MIVVMRNRENALHVHRSDVQVTAPNIPVLVFTLCNGGRKFFVQPTDTSSREDFAAFTFTESTIADPQNGVIALLEQGEYEVALYESATYGTEISAMNHLWQERAVVCA